MTSADPIDELNQLRKRVADLERGVRCAALALRIHWTESPTALALDQLLSGHGPYVVDLEIEGAT